MSATPPLLAIETSDGFIEVRGNPYPPGGVMSGIDLRRSGRLSIRGDVDVLSATYLDPCGETVPWDSSTSRGPLLFEDTTYHLWVDGHVLAPEVWHRDPLFTRDIRSRPARRVASGTFNLGRQVGALPFTVTFGKRSFEIELEVAPTKIDYATDYESLISEVSASVRGLALEYMRSTHRRGQREYNRATDIEWLSTLRREVAELQRAFARINEHPYRHLLREVQPTPIHKIRRLDNVARRSIMRGKGSGPVDNVPGVGPVRRVIDSMVAVSTLDTPEHRLLRTQLSHLHQQLRTLAGALDSEASKGGRAVTGRREAERREVGVLADNIDGLLQTETMRMASSQRQPSPPSLTILGAPGYREAYRVLTGLRLGLAVSGDVLELQTKDIHDLYELWAFLTVVELLTVSTGSSREMTGVVRHHQGVLRIDLQAGEQSEIPLRGGRRNLYIAYNRGYAGATGEQKPDIVIRVQEPGRPDLVVVLDAKYRVDAKTSFRKTFGAPGPPIDAINALHRYRDAIVTDRPSTYRPVVCGAALFPLTKEETAAFTAHSKLYRSLSTLGIGALPLLPGNTEVASDWLAALLSKPADSLLWNGPPGPREIATARGTDPWIPPLGTSPAHET